MTFQDQLNLLRAGEVPLPLLNGQATAQALRLRARGLSYGDIARVMGIYHGWFLGQDAWRERCRRGGAPGRHHPNGAKRIPPQLRKAAS